MNITASVANDSSGKGVSWSLTGAGTLSNQTTTGVTYTAPATVTSTFVATVVATSIASLHRYGVVANHCFARWHHANVVPISVNGGPLMTANPPAIYTNAAFVSVQICAPQTALARPSPTFWWIRDRSACELLGSQLTLRLTRAHSTD